MIDPPYNTRHSTIGVQETCTLYDHHNTLLTLTMCANARVNLTALFANDFLSLKELASLSEEYAYGSYTIFVPDKTNLTEFTHVSIGLDGHPIFPHILNRITAHEKAYVILRSAGVGKTHQATLLASIKAEHCFSTPVILSAMSSVLSEGFAWP